MLFSDINFDWYGLRPVGNWFHSILGFEINKDSKEFIPTSTKKLFHCDVEVSAVIEVNKQQSYTTQI